jgi:gentisate 1,2-dioxygenase
VNELGQLSNLPAEQLDTLYRLNLMPPWHSLRAVLPAKQPRPNTRATTCAYRVFRSLPLQACQLTFIEKAERRVLVLANPGHDEDQPVIWLDVLALPPVQELEGSHHANGARQEQLPRPQRLGLCQSRPAAHTGADEPSRTAWQGLPDAALPLERSACGAAAVTGARPTRASGCAVDLRQH